jgi:FixJ family two-component response regulator
MPRKSTKRAQTPTPPPAPSPARAMVYVVDDDPSVRRSLLRLLHASGYQAEAFASGYEFLNRRFTTVMTGATHAPPAAAECLVLDVCMPAMSGLALQEELARRDDILPIVFITGHGDVPTSVRAMKQGAVDFLTKPCDQQELHHAIATAIHRNQLMQQMQQRQREAARKLTALTAREREVLARVASGAPNKQIATDLSIREPTVKVHRARVMQKLGVTSVAELVRLVDSAPLRAK